MRSAARWGLLTGLTCLGLSSEALATYSPPLTHVRINSNYQRHNISWVTASMDRSDVLDGLGIDFELAGMGAQYLLQIERDWGFGLQFGVAGGPTDVDVDTITSAGLGGSLTDLSTQGLWLGGQFRAYYMLWQSTPADEGRRPSALTAFVNLRGLYYQTQGARDADPEPTSTSPTDGSVLFDFRTVTGGIGVMAEISLSSYLSFAPYAWITPDIYSEFNYAIGQRARGGIEGLGLDRPLLFGADFWLYPDPSDWDRHISLSIIASLIDTRENGNDRTIVGVIGYTF